MRMRPRPTGCLRAIALNGYRVDAKAYFASRMIFDGPAQQDFSAFLD
jgi:hypothetical protein